MDKLKPCPHCGGTRLRVSEPDEKNCWVSCNACNSSGPVDITPQLARKKWNRRAPVEPPAAGAVDPEVEKVWKEFWAPIVAPDGVVNLEQVKKELFDFRTAMENVPQVYRHVTGDRLSKITYPASTVIAAADDHWNESLEDERKEWEKENEEAPASPHPVAQETTDRCKHGTDYGMDCEKCTNPWMDDEATPDPREGAGEGRRG